MRTFVAILAAQVVSLIGTQLTGFGLGVWVFQRTGSATLYGIVSAAVILPRYLGSPLVGVWVDRFDRRMILMGVHVGAGSCSLGLAALHALGRLDVWVIVASTALASLCYAAERPAFAAITTVLVPEARRGRANGMFELGAGISLIVGPALAGLLLERFGLGLVLAVDVATFVLAVIVLACVCVPAAAAAGARRPVAGTIVQEAHTGPPRTRRTAR
ncbi:MFS transporter [Paraliomyxa miuraensis]|uniref:MFS transporter n=1 Tax=Paraliomyxa miuraensis TaxID=376150 RepID=UPI0022564408|nr:MFS transporter [Paraliomyxa miuraensis]MCX4243038.1 MFS transporter [Paraliomyxa miuraensis]